MSTKTNVSTATVREWAKENLSSIPEAGHFSVMGRSKEDRTLLGDGSRVRGRLHPSVVEAFNKAHSKSRKVYAEKVAETPTVTFQVAALDKRGRTYKKSVTITTGEARVLLGHEKGKKGRLSKDALAAAYAEA